MFPLKIGRWSILRQGQKPLCKYRDKYQNMVLTLCRKSPNMYSEEIPKHLFIRVGTTTWNSPPSCWTLSSSQTMSGLLAASWSSVGQWPCRSPQVHLGLVHSTHPKAASLNITGPVQVKEALCSCYSWQAVLGALASLGRVALRSLMACGLHVWCTLGTQVWKKKA